MILFQLYLDRWPVEQVPLVAKQILGLHRQASLCPRKLSTSARVGDVSWQHSQLFGPGVASYPASDPENNSFTYSWLVANQEFTGDTLNYSFIQKIYDA